MARRASRTTRMEKEVQISLASTALGAPALFTWQLEGGDEECQIKRIVLSTAANNQCMVKLGLFQDTPTTATFDAEKVLYISVGNAGAVGIINETTTVRVPRGWHLAIQVDSTVACDSTVTCQLNYLVLS